MSKTVEMYRLWQDGTWDKVEITIPIFEGIDVDVVESRACQAAWLKFRDSEPRPLQIGMIMSSFYKE